CLPLPRVPCNAGVMVLLHNPPMELQNVGDVDMVLEGQDSISKGPFISADCFNTNSMPQLQYLSGPCHKLLLLTVPITPSYVPENACLCFTNGEALYGSDHKQFRAEEHNVTVIPFPHSMVCPPRQGVWFPHAPAWLVVQEEVEVGKVEGLSGLLAIELLGHPEVFKVLVICPDLELVPCTF
ncbi:hypothetical protein C0989_005247, partial [Termitomyces sp. Mn162]